MKKTLCLLAFLFCGMTTGAQAVRTLGQNIPVNQPQTFTVGITPGHQYQLVAQPQTTIGAAFNIYGTATAIQYSTDPPGTSSQIFANWPQTAQTVNNNLLISSTCIAGSTFNNGLQGASVCNLYPMPAATLQVTTAPGGPATGTYELKLIDLTALGVTLHSSVTSTAATIGQNPPLNGAFMLGCSGTCDGPGLGVAAPISTDVSGNVNVKVLSNSASSNLFAPQQADPTVANSQVTGAANTAVTITASTGANTAGNLYVIEAWCSAGSATVTVNAGAVGSTVIWSTPAATVGTTLFTATWPVPLRGTVGGGFNVVLGTCGAGNTGTLGVQMSVF